MGIQRLSTTELPARDRLDKWMQFGSETLSDMVVIPEGRQPFQASLARTTVGRLGFVWMETTAATAIGASRQVGSWALPSGDAYLLRLQDFGQTVIGSGSDATALRPQEMVLRSCGANWSTRVPHRTGLLSVKIPTDLLVSRVADPESLSGRIFSGSTGPGKVAASAILAVKQLINEAPDEDWSDAVEDVLLSALTLAFQSHADNANRAPLHGERERLWRTACLYIDEALGDADLSVTKVAAGTGIGLRTLQRLFVAMGESPREYIMRRRLERASRLLRDDRFGHRVTDVAFAVGFNDLSHFSRAFSRQFGTPPSHYTKLQ